VSDNYTEHQWLTIFFLLTKYRILTLIHPRVKYHRLSLSPSFFIPCSQGMKLFTLHLIFFRMCILGFTWIIMCVWNSSSFRFYLFCYYWFHRAFGALFPCFILLRMIFLTNYPFVRKNSQVKKSRNCCDPSRTQNPVSEQNKNKIKSILLFVLISFMIFFSDKLYHLYYYYFYCQSSFSNQYIFFSLEF